MKEVRCCKFLQHTHIFPRNKAQWTWGSASLYDLAFKLLSAPPLADALQAVSVVAVGEDPKSALAGVGFFIHHLHADPAHHVFATLDGK